MKAIELYDELKGKLGDKEAKLLVQAIEDVSVSTKKEIATKVDIGVMMAHIDLALQKFEGEFTIWGLALLLVQLLSMMERCSWIS